MDPHHHTDPAPASSNALLASFLVLATVLWIFSDVLTAITGTLLIGAVYMSHYKGHSPDGSAH